MSEDIPDFIREARERNPLAYRYPRGLKETTSTRLRVPPRRQYEERGFVGAWVALACHQRAGRFGCRHDGPHTASLVSMFFFGLVYGVIFGPIVWPIVALCWLSRKTIIRRP